MNRWGRRVAATLLATAVVLGVAALSRVPYAPSGGDAAVLRLSWRVRGERVEECRRLSEEEIAKLPIHMRRSEVCEGKVLPYHLHVVMDGRTLADDTVHAAGAREDRPIYVYREIGIDPGTRQLSVRFIQEGRGAAAAGSHEREADDEGDDEDEDEDEDETERPATPARLELTGPVSVRPGEVVLVTYDPDRRALVARTPAPVSHRDRP